MANIDIYLANIMNAVLGEEVRTSIHDAIEAIDQDTQDLYSMIAPTESSYEATRNYSIGSYLIVENTLYKVTSAIASGGTITPGTNVTATTIMAEI